MVYGGEEAEQKRENGVEIGQVPHQGERLGLGLQKRPGSFELASVFLRNSDIQLSNRYLI